MTPFLSALLLFLAQAPSTTAPAPSPASQPVARPAPDPASVYLDPIVSTLQRSSNAWMRHIAMERLCALPDLSPEDRERFDRGRRVSKTLMDQGRTNPDEVRAWMGAALSQDPVMVARVEATLKGGDWGKPPPVPRELVVWDTVPDPPHPLLGPLLKTEGRDLQISMLRAALQQEGLGAEELDRLRSALYVLTATSTEELAEPEPLVTGDKLKPYLSRALSRDPALRGFAVAMAVSGGPTIKDATEERASDGSFDVELLADQLVALPSHGERRGLLMNLMDRSNNSGVKARLLGGGHMVDAMERYGEIDPETMRELFLRAMDPDPETRQQAVEDVQQHRGLDSGPRPAPVYVPLVEQLVKLDPTARQRLIQEQIGHASTGEGERLKSMMRVVKGLEASSQDEEAVVRAYLLAARSDDPATRAAAEDGAWKGGSTATIAPLGPPTRATRLRQEQERAAPRISAILGQSSAAARQELVRVWTSQPDQDLDELRQLYAALDVLESLDRAGQEDPEVQRAYLMAAFSLNEKTRMKAVKAAREGGAAGGVPAAPAVPVAPAVPAAPPAAVETPDPSSPPAAPPAPLERVVQTTLESGLEVVVIQDPALTLTAVVHRVGLGSASELPSQAGWTHLLEHLVFSGTEHYPSGSWDEFMDEVGGYNNAFTDHDATTYVSQVPPDKLEELLDREADRFLNLHIQASELDRERLVVLDEGRLRGGLEPSARLWLELHERALSAHPYGRPPSGTPEALAGATTENIQAYFERGYNTANMQLVVAGPTDVERVQEMIRTRYAGLRKGEPTPPVPAVDPKRMRSWIRAAEPGLRERQVGLMWALPPGRPCSEGGRAPCSPSYWADQIALALLGTGGVDAIEEALAKETLTWSPVSMTEWQGAAGGYVAVTAERRDRAGVFLHNTFNVGGAVCVSACTASTCGFSLPIPPPRHVADIGALRRVLDDLAPNWITRDAIARARASVLQAELRRTWSATARAMVVAERLGLGLPADFNPLTAISRVTEQEIVSRYTALIRQRGSEIHVR